MRRRCGGMSTEPRVCLDLLGAQEAWTADRGVGRFIAEQATAVLDRAPDAVHSLLLHADGEFGLSLMALSGRAPVAYADGEPPHGRTHGPPDVLHVMAPFAQQALHRV